MAAKKLTDEQRQEILQLHNERTFTRDELASRFGVSYVYICKLIRDSKVVNDGVSETSINESQELETALHELETQFPGTIDKIRRGDIVVTKRISIEIK